jgi:predicted O-methyltransferase YrrM
MSDELWSAVDGYIADTLIPPDGALEAALASSAAAGLPAISVAPNQGKLLHVIARMIGAKRILEIGTLGGYSTIWLARALPDGGSLVTLEADPKHADVARANIARAGLSDIVDVRLGLALDTLPLLAAEQAAPFDLVFIDADKANIPAYFAWAEKLTRPGSAILVDNVVRKGALADAASTDPNVIGVRRLHEELARNPRVSATTLQTVGSKGYDGITFAVVLPR